MKVLFVCLGNICRSPMAEAMLRDKIAVAGLDHEVDSAGTGDWHVGQTADPRTLRTLERHGYPAPSVARQLRNSDFAEFDLIVAMDEANVRDIVGWRGADPSRVRLAMEFAPDLRATEVPDPYYGDTEEFEAVYRLLDAATDGILTHLESARGSE